MNDSERTVCRFLESLGLGSVEHEPDGKNPPDFLVAGRIAFEARRLNDNEQVDGVHRGLEVTAKPLHRAVVKALAQSGAPPGPTVGSSTTPCEVPFHHGRKPNVSCVTAFGSSAHGWTIRHPNSGWVEHSV